MVDVVQESVEGAHPLDGARRQPLPFPVGKDARNHVEGNQPLGAVLLAVDVESDAHPAEQPLRLAAFLLQIVQRAVGQPAGIVPVYRADFGIGAVHFVEHGLSLGIHARPCSKCNANDENRTFLAASAAWAGIGKDLLHQHGEPLHYQGRRPVSPTGVFPRSWRGRPVRAPGKHIPFCFSPSKAARAIFCVSNRLQNNQLVPT